MDRAQQIVDQAMERWHRSGRVAAAQSIDLATTDDQPLRQAVYACLRETQIGHIAQSIIECVEGKLYGGSNCL